jgi:hypothetical protein
MMNNLIFTMTLYQKNYNRIQCGSKQVREHIGFKIQFYD